MSLFPKKVEYPFKSPFIFAPSFSLALTQMHVIAIVLTQDAHQ